MVSSVSEDNGMLVCSNVGADIPTGGLLEKPNPSVGIPKTPVSNTLFELASW